MILHNNHQWQGFSYHHTKWSCTIIITGDAFMIIITRASLKRNNASDALMIFITGEKIKITSNALMIIITGDSLKRSNASDGYVIIIFDDTLKWSITISTEALKSFVHFFPQEKIQFFPYSSLIQNLWTWLSFLTVIHSTLVIPGFLPFSFTNTIFLSSLLLMFKKVSYCVYASLVNTA